MLGDLGRNIWNGGGVWAIWNPCVLVIFWASLRVSDVLPSRISMIGPSISGWRALFLSNNGYWCKVTKVAVKCVKTTVHNDLFWPNQGRTQPNFIRIHPRHVEPPSVFIPKSDLGSSPQNRLFIRFWGRDLQIFGQFLSESEFWVDRHLSWFSGVLGKLDKLHNTCVTCLYILNIILLHGGHGRKFGRVERRRRCGLKLDNLMTWWKIFNLRNVESEDDLSIEACVNLIALEFEVWASMQGRISRASEL
jgi:hypothetical protein